MWGREGEITRRLEGGRSWSEALDEVTPLVIDDLRRLARHYFNREAREPSCQPTELVNELYLRFAGSRSQRPRNRKEFFVFAGRILREILVDRARGRLAVRRGGGRVEKVSLEDAAVQVRGDEARPEEVLAVGEALRQLETIDPRQGRLVELRYFAGMTLAEAAEVLGVSQATAERDWSAARRWLARKLAA